MKNRRVLYQIKSLEKRILRHNKEKSIKDKEITTTQMEILLYIFKNEDKDIYQKELENVLNLRRATVSGVLQTMEKNNLITRITDAEDTRTKKIILNEETRNIFLRQLKQFDEIEKVIVDGISEKELEVFFEVIQKMKNNVEKLN